VYVYINKIVIHTLAILRLWRRFDPHQSQLCSA